MNKINNIVVVGGGSSGYLTVYYLLKKFPNIQLIWIYPEENNTIGVGEATIPYVTRFLKDLGINFEDIIVECNGSIKLGLEFDGFYKKGKSFFHGFGGKGILYSLLNNYLMMNNLINPDLLKIAENYAIHFDVNKLTEYLDDKIKDFTNINIIREKIGKIKKDDKGNIVSIGSYKSDFFVDCSGFNRLLINDVIGDNFVDISNKIPNNSALVYRSDYTNKNEQFKNYTKCKAMNYGWTWNIPLKDQLSIGYVFDDEFDVLEEFKNYLESIFGKISSDKIISIKLKTGRNKIHLVNNVMSIGLSSCFIEPLESTGLFFVVYGIESLGDYINGSKKVDIINKNINYNFDITIDFVLAHYIGSNKSNKYWDKYNNKKINYFRKNNLFGNNNWYMVLKGMKKNDIIEDFLGNKSFSDLKNKENIINNKGVKGSIKYIDWYNKV